MEKRRVKSLKRVFLGYLVRFTVTIILTFVVMNLGAVIGLNTGFFHPANYAEKVIQNYDEYMNYYGNYSWIPEMCDYVVCNKEGDILKSSGTRKESEIIIRDYKDRVQSRNGRYYFAFIYENEMCIVNYPVHMSYNSKILNRILPPPFVFGCVLFFLLFILDVFVLASRYTRKMSDELGIVKQATESIRMNQLEFTHERTQIREMNEVLDSLDHMKQELSQSLKKQWKLEESRKHQIQALAHDIKTPLTVLFGNADLLEETELDDEQQDYYSKILMSAQNVESYLNRLLEISQSEKKESLSIEKISIDEILNEVENESRVLVQPKEIKFEDMNDCKGEMIAADRNALKRSVMNLVSNSVEYTENGGIIRLQISEDAEQSYYVMQVEDSGRGFNEQELKNATEQFYQGEESRSSKHHYGLGLSIVKNLVEAHKGTIELSNSTELGGAKVTIRLPK